MKPSELEGLSAAPSGAAGTSGEVSAPKEAVSGRARGIGQICRQLFGIPDYERYLAHAAGAPSGRAGSVTARFLRAGDRAQVRQKRAALLLGIRRAHICGER